MMAQPLKVVIVGAGIGGLTAGLALRQNGHHVTILESSKFSNETGAAIHIAPNANGLLRRLGVLVEDVGANECLGIRLFTPTGQQIMSQDLSQVGKKWQYPWHLVHRGHLHLALWAKAVAKNGKGRPCELKLSSRVRSVDAQNAQVLLENGETVSGDLVLGADGVHSICRQSLDIEKVPIPFDGGHSAFRFLIPVVDLQEDPATQHIVGPPGTMHIAIANDRRLVYYPCVNDTMMNCLLIHPSAESRSDDQSWNQKGDKKRMLEIGQVFGPAFQALLSKASEDTLKVWTLLDMDVLPKWTNSKMALLGDAAHPFLPHQAQGGAQAIEDAMSLAALLPSGTNQSEVEERLSLYQDCRKERADRIQAFTRLSGKSFEEQEKAGVKYNALEFNNYNLSHDEWDNSNHRLQKFLWSKSPYRWRQPLSFGPSPGPRQPQNQLPDVLSIRGQHQTRHTIRFKTSGTFLQRLFPTPAFSFRLPDTVVQASLVCCTLKNMAWLGGTGYSHCGLYIHGAQYTKKNGEQVYGTFMPILFEDLTDPIITGREEIAAPKWGCDIDITEREAEKSTNIKLSWRGTTFGELKFNDLQEPSSPEASENGTTPAPAISNEQPDEGMLMYRYVPAVGQPGVADAEYAVFDPFPSASPETANEQTEQQTNGTKENGVTSGDLKPKKLVSRGPEMKFKANDWSSLPTLHHIAQVFSEMPVFEILEANIEEIDSVGDVRGAHRIE